MRIIPISLILVICFTINKGIQIYFDVPLVRYPTSSTAQLFGKTVELICCRTSGNPVVRQPTKSTICRTTGLSNNWEPTNSTYHYFDNPVVRKFHLGCRTSGIPSVREPICLTKFEQVGCRTSEMPNYCASPL